MTHRERTEANERLILSPAACFLPGPVGGCARKNRRNCAPVSNGMWIASSTARLSAAQAQDAGLSAPGGRPLSHPYDSHLGGGSHCPHDRPGASIERGSHGGRGAGARSGHTPFGHAGERILNEVVPGGFRHNEQSLRVVDVLEKDGDGLNLTYEVRRGILCHTGSDRAETLEGQLLHYADRIAYINADIDDALRGGIIYPIDIPVYLNRRRWAIPIPSGSTR